MEHTYITACLYPANTPGLDVYDANERNVVLGYIQKKENMKEDFVLQKLQNGFHFSFSVNRLKKNLKELNESNPIYKIRKFTIPAGSVVYRGIDSDLGVTDRIMLNKL